MPAPSITVVGAGLAGLAVAEALLQRGAHVTLIEQTGVGAGASGAATGLLHPFPGLRAQMPWEGERAFFAACQQVTICSDIEPDVILARGVWRPCNPSQSDAFRKVATAHGTDLQVQWCEAGPPVALPEGIAAQEGLWIPNGLVVHVPLYLATWCQDLVQRGMKCEQRSWSPSDVTGITVLATGAELGRSLGLELVRGQSLCVQAPSPMPLSCGVAGRAYIAPGRHGWWVGATFEHGATDLVPSPEAAKELLRPRVSEIWHGPTPLLDQPLLEIRTGFRVSAPSHLPVVGRWHGDVWIYSGLGSKGLLYHMYVGDLLSQAILEGRPLPDPIQYRPQEVAT